MENSQSRRSIGRGASVLVLSFIAFISLGMPDGLLGVAWPGIRSTFHLPIDAIALLLVCSTAGYMTSSASSGFLMKKLGVGLLLAFSVLATSLTLLVYAFAPLWPVMVATAVLGGLGAGAIDAGLNTYIAQNYGDEIMQWLHASFGVGITMGPFIMTAAIGQSGRWQPGYIIVSVAQLVLAASFFLTRKRWSDSQDHLHEDQRRENQAQIFNTLVQPGAIVSMLLFFLYTGIELGLGLWAYSLLTESRGVSPTVAGSITGAYWAMFTVGRVVAGLYMKKIPLFRVLLFSQLLALAGAVLLLLNAASLLSLIGIGLIGFAIAPIFPGFVSDTHNRVGYRHQANTIGLQISAAGFGSAVMPSLAGVLARLYGLEVIPVFLCAAIVLLLVLFLFSHVLGGAKKTGRNNPA